MSNRKTSKNYPNNDRFPKPIAITACPISVGNNNDLIDLQLNVLELWTLRRIYNFQHRHQEAAALTVRLEELIHTAYSIMDRFGGYDDWNTFLKNAHINRRAAHRLGLNHAKRVMAEQDELQKLFADFAESARRSCLTLHSQAVLDDMKEMVFAVTFSTS